MGSGVSFPLEDRNWALKVVIGWILSLVPVVNLLTVGYLAENVRMGLARRRQLPDWQDIVGLFALGLSVFVIAFLYLLIPMVVLLAGAGSALWALGGFRLGEVLQVGFAGGAALLGLGLVVLVGLVVPLAIAQYLDGGGFYGAFQVRGILARLQNILGEYLVWYLLYIIALVVLGWLSMIPYVGWILAGLPSFYASLVFANMVGYLYREGEQPRGRDLA